MTDTAAQIATAKDAISACQEALMQLVASLENAVTAVGAISLGPPTRKVAASWGDGIKDATAAIQMEIDALGPSGGVVEVPGGTYMVDAVKSLTVRSGVTLRMAPDTILAAKPNSAPRYYVVRTEPDSAIEGGAIAGDRLKHTYTAGSPHEWGYGLTVGDRVKVTNVVVLDCTGDGIGLSGDDAELREVKCLRNRRNGMSVFAAKRWKVIDSVFANTGALGNDPGAPSGPWAGVDIEPDGAGVGSPVPVCEDGQFINCKFLDNQSAGIKSYKNSNAAVPAVIRNIRVEGCEMAGNTDGAWFSYCEGVTLDKNHVHDNKGYGLHLLLGTYTTKPIEGNEFQNNLTRISTLDRTPDKTVAGLGENRDLKVEATAGACVAGENTYR